MYFNKIALKGKKKDRKRHPKMNFETTYISFWLQKSLMTVTKPSSLVVKALDYQFSGAIFSPSLGKCYPLCCNVLKY